MLQPHPSTTLLALGETISKQKACYATLESKMLHMQVRIFE